MNKKCKDLFQLVEESPATHYIYKSLPDDIKDGILMRADDIRTEEAFCDYADKLLNSR